MSSLQSHLKSVAYSAPIKADFKRHLFKESVPESFIVKDADELKRAALPFGFAIGMSTGHISSLNHEAGIRPNNSFTFILPLHLIDGIAAVETGQVLAQVISAEGMQILPFTPSPFEAMVDRTEMVNPYTYELISPDLALAVLIATHLVDILSRYPAQSSYENRTAVGSSVQGLFDASCARLAPIVRFELGYLMRMLAQNPAGELVSQSTTSTIMIIHELLSVGRAARTILQDVINSGELTPAELRQFQARINGEAVNVTGSAKLSLVA